MSEYGPGRAGVHLVVDQVVQLEHVDVADRRSPARTARRCGRRTAALLPCSRQAGFLQAVVDFLFGRPVEHRRDGLEAELGAGPAQVRLQNLAHVHTAGHAQRIEHDLHRRAVGQERHVFLGQDLGDHALVAVPAGHLVADARSRRLVAT